MREFLEEVKRRNVFRVAIVYIIAGWLTMQVVDVMFPALNIPGWVTSLVAALLLIGFPFALIFAWAFELTPDGIKREKDVDRSQSITAQTGKSLNRKIIVILAVAVSFLLVDKFYLSPESDESVAEIKPSIAVLPFVNMSGDIENEYFSDGLSEEMLNLLAKIPQLHVAGRTSSFQFKGENQDLRQIGELLNVANVLEGSVRQSGTRLRITAQLVNADTGYHLWSETFDRELTDVFAIQDEIATAVVAALRLELLGETAPSPASGTANVEAYNLFLRGLYLSDQTTEAAFLSAIEALRRAIEIDPQFARAYALLAETYRFYVSGFVSYGGVDYTNGFRQVHEYADAALSIDPQLPDALAAKGGAIWATDFDIERAAEYFGKALEHDPNDPGTLSWMGYLRMVQGRDDEAIELGRRVLSVDPLSIAALRSLGDAYRVAGRQDEAAAVYARALDLQPDTARINGRLARMSLATGDFEAAARHTAREPVRWEREMLAIMVNSKGEDSETFQAAVHAYADAYGTNTSYQLAELYGFVGDLDNAFKWLETGIRIRDPGIPWLTTSEFLVSAHNDPRWPEIVAKAGM
ncbi:MAG: tetratricopeptide repeat protein [Woeseiaceae bacterium]|nr:tetratricopeptide repeat protein [Woeseiaceae bacterium]